MLDLGPVLAGTEAAAPDVADEPSTPCAAHVDPESDIHASADYRRMLAGELTRRALRRAARARATEGAA